VTPCSLAGGYLRFRGSCCLHLQNSNICSKESVVTWALQKEGGNADPRNWSPIQANGNEPIPYSTYVFPEDGGRIFPRNVSICLKCTQCYNIEENNQNNHFPENFNTYVDPLLITVSFIVLVYNVGI
jgi:hypothetical protein